MNDKPYGVVTTYGEGDIGEVVVRWYSSLVRAVNAADVGDKIIKLIEEV